jgi:hypothetical protein
MLAYCTITGAPGAAQTCLRDRWEDQRCRRQGQPSCVAWHSAAHAAVEQPPRGRTETGMDAAQRIGYGIRFPVSAFAAASLCTAAASAAENTGLLRVKVRHPRVLDETYIDLELIFLIANNRSRPASALSTRTHTHTRTRTHAHTHTHARTDTDSRAHARTRAHAHTHRRRHRLRYTR